MVIFWILSGEYKNFSKNLRNNRYILLWLLFFLLYAFSFFYSDDKSEALTSISYKSSFLIFPIILGSYSFINSSVIKRAFSFFTGGVIFTFCYCLIDSYISLYPQLGFNAFFYDNLTNGLDSNAVYTGWKCFFALTIIMFYRLHDKISTKTIGLDALIFFLIFVFFVLLCAKTLILIFLGLIVIVGIYYLINFSGRWRLKFVIVFSCLLTTYGLFSIKDSPLKRRYFDATNAIIIRGSTQPFDIQYVDNFNKRMTLWKAAWINIKAGHNWVLGCGIGDAKNVLDNTLCDTSFHYKGFYNICSLKGLYVHNMYLQTLLTIGIMGLAVLILILWFGITTSIKQKHYTILSFYLLAAFFMLQESVLQNQAGIVYMSFFSCLFFNYLDTKDENGTGTLA